MRLTITIDCDNAAFGGGFISDRGAEIARILREYADAAAENTPMLGDVSTLRDYNGNTVGQAKITKGRR